ncbi:MAG: thioredoxin family protein, partial [Planctomycetes bacterium]|nr:thioredoxin family protein [Planctomycetota bacterium]
QARETIRSPNGPLGAATLRLRVSYQGCDAATCYQPGARTVAVAARVVEAGAPAPAANADLFAAADAPPPSPAAPAPAPPPSPAAPPPAPDAAAPAEFRFEGETDVAAWYGRGLPAYLALLFVAGLALNLTPCVFPLIPVTMNVFAQQGEKRPLKVLPLAVVYALGLAATFTVVGVLAALAGRSLGLVLQSPWGVLGLVTVLAVMMASALGAFDIHLPSGAMGRLGARRGLVGAAFMGMVMGAIAAPCVGPFLVALVAFVAASGSVALGAVSFFATGLGLGLPYVFLGTFTGLINRFPHSGGWLVWTKRLLGMGLAGLILYFIRPYVTDAFFWPLVLGLFIFAAAYLGFLEGRSRRPFSARFRAVRAAAFVVILAAGGWFYATYAPATAEAPSPAAGTEAGPEVQWTPWQEGDLEKARADGRPVVLYFGAAWCAECRVWKRDVFSQPEVIEAARPLARLMVDVSETPGGARRAFSDRYRGTNPPAVIVFDRAGRIVKAYRDPPPAQVFAEVLRQAGEP